MIPFPALSRLKNSSPTFVSKTKSLVSAVARACLDVRTIVVAAALAVAAALPGLTTGLVDRRDYYFFDVTLTSSSPGSTQLFWDLGHGYSEQDSSRQPLKIESSPVVYRYMMPMGTMRELRLDPIDGVGSFTFRDARVVNDKGRIIRTFAPEDFTAVNQIARCEKQDSVLIVRTTDGSRDPVLLLKLKSPLVLKSSPRVWFRLGWPKAWPVFAIAMFLGAPAVAAWLYRRAKAASAWIRDRPLSAIAIAATLAVAIQSHPVIFSGRSFASPNNGALMLYGELPTLPGGADFYSDTMGSDVGALLFHHVYFPMVQHDALFRDHELPLWNRYTLAGGPSLGQGQSFFGNPFEFLTILANGAGWAWDVQFVVAHWLFAAGLGFIVWQLTRHLGAALLVTLGGAFISFYTFRINHPANFSVCYSPWILWAWLGLINTSSRRREAAWLVAWVIANWTVMTSGTVKEAYMIMVCLNLTGLALLVLLPAASQRRLRLFLQIGAAGIVFVLLSAPLWMVFLKTLKHSYTVYDDPWAVPFPLSHFVGLFDDIFHRQTVKDEPVIGPGLNVLFLLGVLWWLVHPRLWRTDRAGLALLIGAVVPLSLAFGIVPPAIVTKIPFIKNIHHVGNTFSCSLLTIAAVLAGCGFRDALLRLREPGARRGLAWIAVLGAAIAVPFFLSDKNQPLSAFFHGYAGSLAIAALALLAALNWAVAGSAVRPGPLLAAIALGFPLLLWRHCQYNDTPFNRYALIPAKRGDFYAFSPSVKFVDQQKKEPGRVVGWGHNLFPAYNTALRWEGLYGVETLRNAYYQELTKEFDLTRVWVWDTDNEEKESARLLPAHDLLNVSHYVATRQPAPHAIAGLEYLGTQDLDVFRSPTVWPRAFFTDRLARYATVKDFVAATRQGDRRPFAAIQNTEPSAPSLPAELTGRTVQAAHDYRLTGNTTSFVIDAPGAGVAVLTEAYYPPDDFRVTLNGKPATYFRVNHAFKGIELPAAGTYLVKFEYWPAVITQSLILAAFGLVALTGGFVWLITRERNASVPKNSVAS